MNLLEFKLNVDYKLDSNYYEDKMVMYLSPKIEQYSSWIALNWNPK